MAESTLATHRGAKKVTLQELQLIPAPTATATHKPIPHHVLVENLLEEFDRRRINVVKSQYAVQKEEGLMLFGIMDLEVKASSGDFGAAFGFRTSNDKSLALRAVVGSRVFVCDNLALSGDEIVMKRKHSKHLDIKLEIRTAVDKFFDKYAAIENSVDKMKAYELLSPGMAKELIYDAVIREKVVPMRLMPEIDKEYFGPSFSEFKGENLWNLNNAFTFAAKDLVPNSQMTHLMKVGNYFNTLLGDPPHIQEEVAV